MCTITFIRLLNFVAFNWSWILFLYCLPLWLELWNLYRLLFNIRYSINYTQTFSYSKRHNILYYTLAVMSRLENLWKRLFVLCESFRFYRYFHHHHFILIFNQVNWNSCKLWLKPYTFGSTAARLLLMMMILPVSPVGEKDEQIKRKFYINQWKSYLT